MTVDYATGEIVEFDRPAAERRAERIRLRLDSIADNLTAVMPMIRDAIAQRDDLALGYRSPGEYVADRFGGSLQRLGVEVRRAVVGELTQAGLSTRAIAPVVGVTHKTVVKDRQEIAGGTSVPPAPKVAAGAQSGADSRVESRFKSETAPDTGPQGDGEVELVAPASDPRPAVTGIDGKACRRPTPRVPTVTDAVAEFPDLAFYADLGQERDVLNMADDLRRFRGRGELDMRLDALRRSIAIDRAKRDGTYRDGTTAVMGEDGIYQLRPIRTPAAKTCPTCHGSGSIEETQ